MSCEPKKKFSNREAIDHHSKLLLAETSLLVVSQIHCSGSAKTSSESGVWMMVSSEGW